MTSHDLYWATAQQVCTDKQLRVLELRERHYFSPKPMTSASPLHPA